MIRKILLSICLICTFISLDARSHWTLKNPSDISSEHQIIKADEYSIFYLDEMALKTELDGLTQSSSFALDLPSPSGEMLEYNVKYAPVMHERLAAKFPGIRTYKASHIDHASEWGRLDFTHKGFHGMIFTKEGTYFIDPFAKDTPGWYIVYYKKHFQTDKMDKHSCQVGSDHDHHELDEVEAAPHIPLAPISPRGGGGTLPVDLTTYRLAVCATGEYTQFHGGTKADAMAAIVTTINRVNQVYERDVAVHLELVPNNEDIVYESIDTDPFSNGLTWLMISQSHNTCNSVIGSANYDVGHVFGTDSGGLAQLGVICNNGFKGYGVTGSGAPIGDPFDIDYVAHELGHQFGANHTFNNCGGNENPSTAFEPGSGSTVMAYAGLCGGNNVQFNSDDYFHVGSLVEMYNHVYAGGGSTCAQKTITENTSPTVAVPTGNWVIPHATPFELEGGGFDLEGDEMSYCWEQFDVGPSSNLGLPSSNAPGFRSYDPTTDPVRVFPKISTIINNGIDPKEVLTTYARDYKFRLTVRDNNEEAGGVTWDEVSFSAVTSAGPFLVNEPNLPGVQWNIGETATVTWDVAGTDLAPVNSSMVNIYLSTDGGLTYPIELLTNTPNDGSAEIVVPNAETGLARIKVKGADNIFFDISNFNFTIRLISSSSDIAQETFGAKVYPNPAASEFYISFDEIPPGDVVWELYDIRGVLVANGATQGKLTTVSPRNLAPGMYRLSVTGSDWKWNEKILLTD